MNFKNLDFLLCRRYKLGKLKEYIIWEKLLIMNSLIYFVWFRTVRIRGNLDYTDD